MVRFLWHPKKGRKAQEKKIGSKVEEEEENELLFDLKSIERFLARASLLLLLLPLLPPSPYIENSPDQILKKKIACSTLKCISHGRCHLNLTGGMAQR